MPAGTNIDQLFDDYHLHVHTVHVRSKTLSRTAPILHNYDYSFFVLLLVGCIPLVPNNPPLTKSLHTKMEIRMVTNR